MFFLIFWTILDIKWAYSLSKLKIGANWSLNFASDDLILNILYKYKGMAMLRKIQTSWAGPLVSSAVTRLAHCQHLRFAFKNKCFLYHTAFPELLDHKSARYPWHRKFSGNPHRCKGTTLSDFYFYLSIPISDACDQFCTSLHLGSLCSWWNNMQLFCLDHQLKNNHMRINQCRNFKPSSVMTRSFRNLST